tara:strand:- start:125 stop:394 length:270 start_codon:yes stop_codon:yes gene_type:complete
MTSETDAKFVERMTPFHSIKSTDSVRLPGDDFARLFALARRGAEAAARIEQLEAALRKITDRLEDDFNDGRPMRRYELEKARAALEDRT